MPAGSGHARSMTMVVVTGVASGWACGSASWSPPTRRSTGCSPSTSARRPAVPAGVEVRSVDLPTADLKPFLEGAEAVVHLALGLRAVDGRPRDRGRGAGGHGATGARRRRRRVGPGGGHRLVGDRVRRLGQQPGAAHRGRTPPALPRPGLRGAEGEVERLALEWREEHPDSTVACCARARSSATAAPGGWRGRSTGRSSRWPHRRDDPPAQFLHLDDLASAVDVARRRRLDGPVNVAPDGWLTGTRASRPRSRRPACACPTGSCPRWRPGAGGCAWPRPRRGSWRTPRHPWVVANDRLRVDGLGADVQQRGGLRRRPRGRTAIETLRPRRRQELALGAAGGAVVAAGIGGVAAVRRARRT